MKQTTYTDLEHVKREQWFDDLVADIRKDQVMLETGTASEETQKRYATVMSGNMDQLASDVRASSTIFFIESMVRYYIQQLKKRGKKPLKLALDFSNAKVMVWAEIMDDDEDTEDALLLSEASTNAYFHEHGFHIASTIVEQSDKMTIPPHYQVVVE